MAKRKRIIPKVPYEDRERDTHYPSPFMEVMKYGIDYRNKPEGQEKPSLIRLLWRKLVG